MRRNVVLILALAAFIVLVVLLRPRPTHEPRVAKAPPSMPTAVDEVIDEPIESPIKPPPSPPAPGFDRPRPPPSPGQARPVVRECYVTVVDIAGVGVPEATVLAVIHSYGRPSAQSKVEEKRADTGGVAKVNLGVNDTADIFAYKDGIGTGWNGMLSTEYETTVRLLACRNLDVRCLGIHDVPLEGAEIVLTTEVVYLGRREVNGVRGVTSIPLPARKVRTALDGSAAFEAVFPPIEFNDRRRATPGIRHQVSAEWHRMAAKVTVDKPIDEPVLLYPQ